MTTIEAGSNRISFRDEVNQMHITIECRGARTTTTLGVFVKREEVLAALDAVPREDFDKAVALSEQRQIELEKAEATIERVEVLAGKWVLMGGVTRQRGFELSAALNPPKPFEMPITVPARIEARPDWWAEDDPEGGRMVLKLWTDGSALIWSTEDGDDGYSPEQVMREFTDHRLLDGAA